MCRLNRRSLSPKTTSGHVDCYITLHLENDICENEKVSKSDSLACSDIIYFYGSFLCHSVAVSRTHTLAYKSAGKHFF
jgi:hypothetical protein